VTSWSFKLPYGSPPKGLNANDSARSHWARTKATKQVRDDSYWMTHSLNIPKMHRIRVDVEWVVAIRRNRDASNLGLFTKPIYDAIGAAHEPSVHVVPDDTAEFMQTPTPTIRYEQGCTAHFIITITDISTTEETS
jgi:hypothetical protein